MSNTLTSTLIMSYGMPKSASTFAWMLLKAVARNSGGTVVTLSAAAKGNNSKEDYVLDLEGDRADRIAQEVGARCVVIKTHSGVRKFTGYRKRFANSFVFVQHRDPREIALSLIDHGARARKLGIPDFAQCVDFESTYPFIDDAMQCLRGWIRRPNSIAISYDDLCFETDQVIRRICAHLGTNADADRVLAAFSDKSQIIQFNKGVKARWKDEMPPAASDAFLRRYRQYYNGAVFRPRPQTPD